MFDVPYTCGFFGHSHAARLFGAYYALVSQKGEDTIRPLFKFGLLRSLEMMQEEGGGPGEHQTAWHGMIADIMTSPAPDVIVTILKGSASTVISLPRHPRPFDFVVPGAPEPELASRAEVIPYALIRRVLNHELHRWAEDFLRVLAAKAQGLPIYIVPPPPPVKSEEFLSRQTSLLCRKVAAEGANPRPLRRKFWLAYLATLRDFARQHGAEFIELPPEVYDEDGFLAERYWEDATHGNADYSLLILETVDRAISRRMPR